MTQKKDPLAPSQRQLIPAYRQKWRNIALSTDPIDRKRAREAIVLAYELLDLPQPDIVFCESPYSAYKILQRQPKQEVNRYFQQQRNIQQQEKLIKVFDNPITQPLYSLLQTQLKIAAFHNLFSDRDLCLRLRYKLNPFREYPQVRELLSDVKLKHWFAFQLNLPLDSLLSLVFRQLSLKLEEPAPLSSFGYCLFEADSFITDEAIALDFCISVLNCSHDRKIWQVTRSILENCGLMFLHEKTCYVCDRPRILSLNNSNYLHGEGKPAMQFADGFSIYAYHGILLPEDYGKLLPSQWPSEWLSSEDNSTLRQAILEKERYQKLSRKLPADCIENFTCLANRKGFSQYLERQWQKYRERDRTTNNKFWLSLIICDLDRFKHYHDYFGHSASDNCLQQVASAIDKTVQQSEALVARYGGDEFAVILPKTDAEEAVRVAERIQEELKKVAIAHPDSTVSDLITLSFGIASIVPNDKSSPELLIETADANLNQAKLTGRNCIFASSPEDQTI